MDDNETQNKKLKTRGPGRPRINPSDRKPLMIQVNVAFTVKEVEMLNAMADEMDMSRSKLLRMLIFASINER